MSITIKDYKKRILKDLERIPESSVKSVVDYIEYLADKESWKETKEIYSDKRVVRQLSKAKKDWNHGKPKKGTYVEWRKIRQNV